MGKVYEKLGLTVTQANYVFTPLYEPASALPNEPIQTLTVNRKTKQLKLNATPEPNTSVLQELVVYGILGFCQLEADEYMIVVTGRTLVGTLLGHDILRVTTFQILPMGQAEWDRSFIDGSIFEQEQNYIRLLESHLRLNSFYFSYTYDLTNSLQRQSQQQVDERFFWNHHLSTKLSRISTIDGGNVKIKPFILPVIQGYVSVTPMTINSKHITFALISRRSQKRAGTRYFSRGIDEEGNVSNYVETEQILVYDLHSSSNSSNSVATSTHSTTNTKQSKLSFVQTRGSIPIFWGQIPNTRYVPQLWYDGDVFSKNLPAAKKHFDEQLGRYGPNILINLTNKTGYEQPLSELYAKIIHELGYSSLRYIHYDFHHECKNLQWHRVQTLIDRLVPDLERNGYCCIDEDNKLTNTQKGVIRTNCIDCLDRTNVVQSMLAKWMIQQWQQNINLNVLDDTNFMSIFNSAWADNADGLSLSYSGTGALKTDFTRRGKRTSLGMWNDLTNSIIRYIKNNYFDGSRQDGIDLFLGKYTRDTTHQHRIQYNHGYSSRFAPWKVQIMPPTLVASTFSFFWLLFFSDSTPIESPTLYILLLSFCFTVSVFTWLFIQEHGTEFIDWPKLNPLYVDTFSSAINPPDSFELSHLLSTNWLFHTPEKLDEAEKGKKVT